MVSWLFDGATGLWVALLTASLEDLCMFVGVKRESCFGVRTHCTGVVD